MMTERFVARFQHNLESWRAGEIDYATFSDCNRQTWEAIAEAGKDVEAEVVAGLRGEALLADVGLLADEAQRTYASICERNQEGRSRRRSGVMATRLHRLAISLSS